MRIHDGRWLSVEAAYIDWLALLRSGYYLVLPTFKHRITVALRWHLNAGRGNLDGDGKDQGIGLPTGPFTVWRRPSFQQELQELAFDVVHYGLFGGMAVARFDRRVAMASLQIDSPFAGAVFGLSDPNQPLSIVTRSTVPAGVSTIELHGTSVAGVLMPGGSAVVQAFGVPTETYSEDSGWDRVEIVGLPVDQSEWASVGTHADDQGLVGAEGPPIDAALQRLARGMPPFGWRSELETGVAAPPWEPPDPTMLIDEVQTDILKSLRDVLVLDQIAQALHAIGITVPPPSTLGGTRMPANSSVAHVSPVAVLQLAVATDPFLSLALGYGTNLDEPEASDVKPYHDGSTWDYMVTAPYARGLDGRSDPVELVALAPRPTRVLPPLAATGLAARHLAHISPEAVDQPWAASVDVSWQRPLSTTIFRVASHAVTRHDPGDAVATPLMEEREAGGHRPVAPQAGTDDPDPAHYHHADSNLSIPNNPGVRTVRYGVATQNLFGLWSPWRVAHHTVAQPAPSAPRIVSATLDVVAPATGKVCPGTLVVDLTWDWTDRRPERITLLGRLFAAATRGAAPPAGAVLGLDRSLGGGQPAVELVFSADTATLTNAPGGSLTYLNPAGDRAVAAGAAQSHAVRRYRLTIPGFTVDFSATPHAGLALHLGGRERLAPGHTTPTVGPTTVFASDPVAPVMPPPIVPLGSLPDAEGRSHGRLAWPTVAGAAAYLVYASDEPTLLAHYGLSEPDPAATLSDRFDTLLDEFEVAPDRRPFTRLTPEPITETSLELTLPKGSRAIHAYVVVTTSPGAAEGPWPVAGPAARNAMRALAAPRLAALPPPELVARALPDGTVAVEVTTRSAQPLEKVDIHRVRVDEAARDFDTMGPPVASVAVSGGSWTVTTRADGRQVVAGADAPGPSWRRVWYRAVAWGGADPLRGVVRGRSMPSNPFAVVVPPPGPPNLSPLTVLSSGTPEVQVEWTSSVPTGKTALGTHRLEWHAVEIEPGPPETRTIVVADTVELERLPTVAPTTGHGAWRAAGAGPHVYRAVVRRASIASELVVSVRLVDPMGRASEHSVGVPPGGLPAPDLADLSVVTIAGRGTILSFTSAAPLITTAAGPYVLSVTTVGPPLIDPLRPGGGRTPPGRRLGDVIDTAVKFGSLLRSVWRRVVETGDLGPSRDSPLMFFEHRESITVRLPDVPVGSVHPTASAPLVVSRAPGDGPRYQYGAITRLPIDRFEVSLRAPDGRVVRAAEDA